MITVFGQPGCQQCRMTVRRLEAHRMPFAYRDVSVDDVAHDELTLLGYGPGTSLPVVVAGDMHWSGFRTEKIDRVVEIIRNAPTDEDLETAATNYLMGT